MMLFLLLFVIAPLVELYFLIQVGSVIGALPTILLSVLTALIGGYLVRMQGLAVLMRVRALLDAGHGGITTEIAPEGPFYYAEPYHQQYLSKVPNGYCGLAGTGVSCPAPGRATA